MNPNIRILIVQLKDGRKLMRIEDDATGLSVERNLSPEHPLVAQKISFFGFLNRYFSTTQPLRDLPTNAPLV